MVKKVLGISHYFILYALLAVAYLLGLFVPLMDSDSAHHANIALHMYLQHDFVNLIDRGQDYLDKPHLLFWLAGAFYSVFGVTAFAYKLPSFLMSIYALYATRRLGERLYDAEVGKLAALILGSAQAFILAVNDVRMDALLTACIILATWQLVELVHTRKWYHYLLAALFMAMGFATKGLVGIIMPGIAIFFYLLYRRDFGLIFNVRWLLVALLLAIFMAPVVYCYYLQFDLHPEKVIRGRNQISGIEFILWGQNTERLEGKNWGGGKRDYFFYLHTMLWAFLPWSILAYYAIGSRLKHLVKTRFAYFKNQEGLTISTIVLIFVLISISQFQLPHYLNILFPFFAILIASKLMQLQYQDRQKPLKAWFVVQAILASLLCLAVLLLTEWAFPIRNWKMILLGFAVLVLVLITLLRKDVPLVKIITVSVTAIAFVNILLNGHFYPRVLDYQGGSTLARFADQRNIPADQVVFYKEHSFSFDFDRAQLTPIVELNDIKNKKGSFWVFTNPEGLDSLKMAGLSLDQSFMASQFRATRLSFAFLNPETRPATLRRFYFVEVKNQP